MVIIMPKISPYYTIKTNKALFVCIFAVMFTNTVNVEHLLSLIYITAFNEMQLASIEANKTGSDIVLLSATGSGKTLAFLMPLLSQLQTSNKKTQAIVIVPSRELAMQIEKVFKSLGSGFKVTCCY